MHGFNYSNAWILRILLFRLQTLNDFFSKLHKKSYLKNTQDSIYYEEIQFKILFFK